MQHWESKCKDLCLWLETLKTPLPLKTDLRLVVSPEWALWSLYLAREHFIRLLKNSMQNLGTLQGSKYINPF